MKTGKVWLVGAGPGDVGLMTIKGKKVLEQAEVVVYDALVGASILSMIPAQAERIDVGKRAGKHTLPQEKINQLLYKRAKEGKRVVRLKGGDPFLFGRGGEELELLAQNHIPYEIVPGVPSAIAVPAYNGIPVTHRDFCSSVHIITGHKRSGEPLDIDFSALVQTRGTLVFLMGVTALPDICHGLLEAGMDRGMPAAILQQGTTAGQKRVVATIETLSQEATKQGIITPAIIVVGKVCALADQLAWMEQKPLFGRRVIVTRPRQLVSKMAEKLQEKGAEVLELPTIETRALPCNGQLKQACAQLECGAYGWIVFTSPTGVRMFLEKLREEKKDIRILGSAKIAAIGLGTSRALLEAGLITDLLPEIYDGCHLGQALCQAIVSENHRQKETGTMAASTGKERAVHVLLPRAKRGNQELLEELSKASETGVEVRVDDLPVYETISRSDLPVDVSRYVSGEIPCTVCFTSASTVRGFAECLTGQCGKKQADGLMKEMTAACIGKQTAAQAETFGMSCMVADEATMDSLVECIVAAKTHDDHML